MEKMRLELNRQTLALFFEGMRPLEISEYLLLSATIAAFPFSWSVAVWGMLLWLLNGIVRMSVHRAFGNEYRRSVRWALLLPPALFLLYLATMGYTENVAEGWGTLSKKLPMLLVPCYFLVGRLAFLTRRRLRALGYLFAASCALLGAAFIVTALWKIAFRGAASSVLFYTSAMVPHHTYSAMYFLLSLSFLYLEHRDRGAGMPRWQKAAMLACGIVLVAITYLVQSRSGLLCLLVLFVAALADYVLVRNRHRRGVLAVAAVLVAAFAALFLAGGQNRLLQTAKAVSSDKGQDARIEIWSNALQVIKENPVLGVGVGDRFDELEHNHERHFLPSPHYGWHPYNPHNQFLDAWLAAGLPGLLLTVSLFVVPLAMAMRARPRQWLVACFLFVAFVACLVESVLERQMGILFVVFAYSLLLSSPPAPTSSR